MRLVLWTCNIWMGVEMRITRIVFIGLGMVFFSLRGVCQSSSAVNPEEKSEVAIQHSFHPKLAMQAALSNAEKFIESEQIDARHFWLYRAQYILQGDATTPAKDKVPGWHFWWVSDAGEMGNYIEIFVTMDGQCRRMPSM